MMINKGRIFNSTRNINTVADIATSFLETLPLIALIVLVGYKAFNVKELSINECFAVNVCDYKTDEETSHLLSDFTADSPIDMSDFNTYSLTSFTLNTTRDFYLFNMSFELTVPQANVTDVVLELTYRGDGEDTEYAYTYRHITSTEEYSKISYGTPLTTEADIPLKMDISFTEPSSTKTESHKKFVKEGTYIETDYPLKFRMYCSYLDGDNTYYCPINSLYNLNIEVYNNCKIKYVK